MITVRFVGAARGRALVLATALATSLTACQMAASPLSGPRRSSATRSSPTPPAASATAQPAAPPVRLCGIAHNITSNVDIKMEIDVKPGEPFRGLMIVGDVVNGARLSATGGGDFSGARAGGVCQATTAGQLTFHGQCDDRSITANYSGWGQTGTFALTSAGCAGR